ncbi:MAG: DUF5719 family protein [Terriglobia bacterium]
MPKFLKFIIRKKAIFPVLLLSLSSFAFGQTGKVTVAWDPIPDPSVGGYTVVWGTASKTYSGSQDIAASLTELTLTLQGGKTYFFAVRGFDKSGVAGHLSNEVSTVVKAGDTTPPVISSIAVSNITSSAATIAFDTDEDSYVQVKYGTSAALGSFTGLTNVSSKLHQVVVSNLSSSTTYFFQVVANDLFGNQAVSEISSFKTKAGTNDQPDPNAPIKFIQITLSNVSSNSVTVNWDTDKATTGFVQYGPDTNFGFNAFESSSLTSHSTVLTNLAPSTLYRYRITAIDSENNQVVSGILMFKTADRVSQPARPSSQAIFIPSIVENSRFRTNLGINNETGTIANVNLTLVDKQGIVLGGTTISVEPNGLKQINSVARVLYADNLGNDIEGDLYLESDQDIKAWASQIDNSTNDPSLLVSRHTGSTKLLIPSAANIGKFTSSLVMMNIGLSNAQVTLKAYGTGGNVLGQTSAPLSIPPNGILSFDNVLNLLGVTNNYGPIEITSQNSVPIIASSRVSNPSGSGGFFEGLDFMDASTLQYIPHVLDTDATRTNLGINNVTDKTASVTIRLYNRQGAILASSLVAVAPKGLTQVNNIVRTMLSQGGVTNQEGYLQLDSDQPIFGWVSQIDNSTDDPGFATSKGIGSTHLLVQSTANVGSFKSSLVIVNIGDSDAAVDIISHDSAGEVQGQARGILIPKGGFYSTTNILATLGVNSSYGPVEIISTNGQPILATSRVYSDTGTSGFFEGQAME